MGVGGQCDRLWELGWHGCHSMAAIFLTTSVLCIGAYCRMHHKNSEVGIGIEISLHQALFILF